MSSLAVVGSLFFVVGGIFAIASFFYIRNNKEAPTTGDTASPHEKTLTEKKTIDKEELAVSP